MKAGGWERRQGVELEGKTLGVIGTGKIGQLVARFGLAFDMKVIGSDPYPDAALAKTPGFRYASVAELLAASDVVTLHCPHEPGAKPLVDAAALASMKKGAAAGEHGPLGPGRPRRRARGARRTVGSPGTRWTRSRPSRPRRTRCSPTSA